MSVLLAPSNTLGFRRPLNVLVKRPLSITNHNAQSIVFKVKTTAPALYCVRPNSGRLNPGQSIDVSVMLQPLIAEPPFNAKCKDKFMVLSTLITPEKEAMSLQDIWTASTDAGEDSGAKVHQQKLRVVYLPAEGETLVEEEEEEEGHSNASILSTGVSRYATGPHSLLPNGETESVSPSRLATPRGDVRAAPDEYQANYASLAAPEAFLVSSEIPASALEPDVPAAAPSVPGSAPAERTQTIPVALSSPLLPRGDDYAAKYAEAQAEIERLRVLLAASQPPAELRRRRRSLSGDRNGVDVAVLEGTPIHEGVPPEIVMIIALGVFFATYLYL